MTDLKECQENVQKCIDWANETLAVGAQNTYFEMARAWLNLANIERAQARQHDKLVPFSHRDVDSPGDDRPSRRKDPRGCGGAGTGVIEHNKFSIEDVTLRQQIDDLFEACQPRKLRVVGVGEMLGADALEASIDYGLVKRPTLADDALGERDPALGPFADPRPA